jgi:hypothetical protein
MGSPALWQIAKEKLRLWAASLTDESGTYIIKQQASRV